MILSHRGSGDPAATPEDYPEEYIRSEYNAVPPQAPGGPTWPGSPRFWEEQVLHFLSTGWPGVLLVAAEAVTLVVLTSVLTGPLGPTVALALTAVAMVCLAVIFWSAWSEIAGYLDSSDRTRRH